MKCDICKRGNAEYVGIQCGKYRVCMLCIQKLIAEWISENDDR
jgi:hypothetical protein